MTKKTKITVAAVIAVLLAGSFVVGLTCGFFDTFIKPESNFIWQRVYRINKFGSHNTVTLENCKFGEFYYTATIKGMLDDGEDTVIIPAQDVEFTEKYGEWWYADLKDESGNDCRIYALRSGKGAVLEQQEINIAGEKMSAIKFNSYGDINFLRYSSYDYIFYSQSDKKNENESIVNTDRLAGMYLASEAIDFSLLYDNVEDDELYAEMIVEMMKGNDVSDMIEQEEVRLYAQTVCGEHGYDSITFSQGKGTLFLDYQFTEEETFNGENIVGLISYGDAIYSLKTSISSDDDDTDSYTHEGTIDLLEQEDKEYYLYAVYQTENEELYIPTQTVYVVSSICGSSKISSTYTETVTKSEKVGSTVRNETTEKKTEISFRLNYNFVRDFNDKITVKSMDRDDNVISVTVLNANAISKSYDVPAGADYILVEREAKNGEGETELIREMYTEDNELFDAPTLDEYGFGIYNPVFLNWGE